jgi:hypothetical protein
MHTKMLQSDFRRKSPNAMQHLNMFLAISNSKIPFDANNKIPPAI